MDESELERFFGSLNAGLEEANASARQELARFFNGLAPRWEKEHTQSRKLALHFNAFDYLRTDELGLSRVIADLLNRKGSHGQDDAFLRLLLGMLEFNDLNPQKSEVRIELPIENGRLDIVVRTENACLAIENKPYAHDQSDQVKKYLHWLRKEYTCKRKGSFQLIYLSPTGTPPSEESVELEDLKEHDETFRIMPYHRVEGGAWEDGFERTNFGLTDWFKACRKHCDVKRLRWFLREAQTFCERKFGGETMSTGEVKTIKKFVLESNRNVLTAAAIFGAWDSIKDDVLKQFIDVLHARIKNELPGDMVVNSNYGRGRYDSWVGAWGQDWEKYQIDVISDAQGPRAWLVGIYSEDPLTAENEKERDAIQKVLRSEIGKGRQNPHRPWWKYVDRFQDWGQLIPNIHSELQEKPVDHEITDYFVTELVVMG